MAFAGSHSPNRLVAAQGYVTLTSKRLLYTGSRTQFLGGKVAIRLDQIVSTVEGHPIGVGRFLWGQEALTVVTSDGRSRAYWALPRVLDKLVAELTRLTGSEVSGRGPREPHRGPAKGD